MPQPSHTGNAFPAALRKLRRSQQIPQEAFDLISSRTYISALERGIKSPTLKKVDELATVLQVHPLTLLTLSYLSLHRKESWHDLAALVEAELRDIFESP